AAGQLLLTLPELLPGAGEAEPLPLRCGQHQRRPASGPARRPLASGSPHRSRRRRQARFRGRLLGREMTPNLAQGESPAIERARLAVILTTIGMSVGGMIVFSLVAWSAWRSAVLLNLSENALLIGFILWRRDRLFPQ